MKIFLRLLRFTISVIGNWSDSTSFESKILTKKGKVSSWVNILAIHHLHWLVEGITGHLGAHRCFRKRFGGWPDVDKTTKGKENVTWCPMGSCWWNTWSLAENGNTVFVKCSFLKAEEATLHICNLEWLQFTLVWLETLNGGVSRTDAQGLWEARGQPAFSSAHFVVVLLTWPRLFVHRFVSGVFLLAIEPIFFLLFSLGILHIQKIMLTKHTEHFSMFF